MFDVWFYGVWNKKRKSRTQKKKKKKKKLNREYKLKFLVRKEKFFMHSCVIFSFFYFSSHGLALRFFSSLFQIFKLHTYWEPYLFLLTWLLSTPKFLAVSLYFSLLSPTVKRKDTADFVRRWVSLHSTARTPHRYVLFYVFFFFLITKNQIFSKRVKDSFVINK